MLFSKCDLSWSNSSFSFELSFTGVFAFMRFAGNNSLIAGEFTDNGFVYFNIIIVTITKDIHLYPQRMLNIPYMYMVYFAHFIDQNFKTIIVVNRKFNGQNLKIIDDQCSITALVFSQCLFWWFTFSICFCLFNCLLCNLRKFLLEGSFDLCGHHGHSLWWGIFYFIFTWLWMAMTWFNINR